MSFDVKIMADSVNSKGSRLTSFLLKYPRFIHSEFMTHRVFSRNAASSRAIPVAKIISEITNDPAMPIYWGAAQKGMQASVELEPAYRNSCQSIWLHARDEAIKNAEHLISYGLHKQVANRILEPWMHMTTLATASELGNFFNLRVHKDAQPEFQHLAAMMLKEYSVSVPELLYDGEWHVPYACEQFKTLSIDNVLKVATARCARTSYKTFEGESDIEKDIALHDRLATSGHWSPFEHCAMAGGFSVSNFHSTWLQYRKMFGNENNYTFDGAKLLEGVCK